MIIRSSEGPLKEGVPYPVGKDGHLIKPREHVYGEDGLKWLVKGVSTHVYYSVIGYRKKDGYRDMKASWLTHKKPNRWEDLRLAAVNLTTQEFKKLCIQYASENESSENESNDQRNKSLPADESDKNNTNNKASYDYVNYSSTLGQIK